ncbi:hypothetical protein UFOVP345_48 [uncultured Caudovirales phage]|uniref:Uncharacterized protein n=1 Tax=uncultured Caudovirales phage TaxID=2100421 RepID=A0A6J5M6H7_9CAUD|nr:hypothetical protein UFOVP345_48 [uncultured Caudovirales phage]
MIPSAPNPANSDDAAINMRLVEAGELVIADVTTTPSNNG